jgi:hypothetical protein
MNCSRNFPRTREQAAKARLKNAAVLAARCRIAVTLPRDERPQVAHSLSLPPPQAPIGLGRTAAFVSCAKKKPRLSLNALVSKQRIVCGPSNSISQRASARTMEVENESNHHSFGTRPARRWPGVRRRLPQFPAGSTRLLLPWQSIHLDHPVLE